MNLQRASVRGMVWVGIEGGGTLLLSLITLFWMGRIVGPRDFGLAAIGIAIVQFAGLFSEKLLQDAMVQRHELTPEHESTAHCASFAIGVLGLMLCIALAVPLARVFDQPDFAFMLIAAAAPLPLMGLIAVPTARLRRAFQFRALVTRTLASRLSGVVSGPVLALLGFGAWSLILQHIGGVVVSVALVMQASPPNVKLTFRWARFRELIAIGGPITATGLAHMMQDRLFLALVGTVLDVRAAGFVNMTFRLAGTLKDTVMTAVSSVSMVTLARQQTDAAGLRRTFEENQRFVSLLAHPVFFGLFATSDQIVPLVLGDAWLALVPLMQAMALASVFQFAVYQSEAVLAAIGRPGPATAFFALSAAAVTGLVPLLHPPTPFTALLIWIGVMVVAAPAWIAIVAKVTGWNFMAIAVPGARSLLCAAAMACGVVALDAAMLRDLAELPRLLAKMASGAVMYAALTLIFNRATVLRFVAALQDRGPLPISDGDAATPAR